MRASLKAPIPWFGGKTGMARRITDLLPEHHAYIEVFGGSAALLFRKEPAPIEVYNDLDGGLVGFYRVLQEPRLFARFKRIVEAMPYSRAEYYRCRQEWQAETDCAKRAAMWFYVARASFSGLFGSSWAHAHSATRRGMSMIVSAWLSAVQRLPECHARLRRVQIEQLDFRVLIPRYDQPGAFFYLDPPYIPETRRAGQYACEMTAADHEELADLLLGVKGNAILSGYRHPVYERLEAAGWERRDFTVACRAAAKTRATGLTGVGGSAHQTRTECLWLSPGIKE